MRRNTQAPDSYRWSLLPLFCRLKRQPWTFRPTSEATVEWQWSNSSSISNCLYPLWAWHEIHFLSVFNLDFGQLFIQSEFWNGLIPNSDFGQIYIQSKFLNGLIPSTIVFWATLNLVLISKWADSQFEFWTTLDSVRIGTNQSKWIIWWEFLKRIRLLKLEVR